MNIANVISARKRHDMVIPVAFDNLDYLPLKGVGVVYSFKNVLEQYYCGTSRNIKERILNHIRGDMTTPLLWRSIEDLGLENHELRILFILREGPEQYIRDKIESVEQNCSKALLSYAPYGLNKMKKTKIIASDGIDVKEGRFWGRKGYDRAATTHSEL